MSTLRLGSKGEFRSTMRCPALIALTCAFDRPLRSFRRGWFSFLRVCERRRQAASDGLFSGGFDSCSGRTSGDRVIVG